MATKTLTDSTSRISLSAARLAISAVVTYQVLLFVLILIRPELDPSWHTISEWALGRHGWIMTLAFLISATSYAALFAMVKSQVRGVIGMIGVVILFICVIGTVGVGIFTMDPFDTPTLSTRGILHIVGGSSALMLLPFAALLINLSLAWKNEAWAGSRKTLLWTAGLPLLGFVGFMTYHVMFVVPLGPNAYGPGVHIGWPPRFALFTYMVWLVTLAWQAIQVRGVQLQSQGWGLA
jgi:hypothetical protein